MNLTAQLVEMKLKSQTAEKETQDTGSIANYAKPDKKKGPTQENPAEICIIEEENTTNNTTTRPEVSEADPQRNKSKQKVTEKCLIF